MIEEVQRSGMNHVGPAGLDPLLKRLPRPDGRGYCIAALRASPPRIQSIGVRPSILRSCSELKPTLRGPKGHHSIATIVRSGVSTACVSRWINAQVESL